MRYLGNVIIDYMYIGNLTILSYPHSSANDTPIDIGRLWYGHTMSLSKPKPLFHKHNDRLFFPYNGFLGPFCCMYNYEAIYG